MRVSEAVIDRLVENGIDTLFGIPGKQTLPLNEAVDERNDVEFVMARHETAVSHQAWGYAETSGEMAATVVIPGPGDMNAMNGLKNAKNDCTPVLHVAVETEPELRGGDGIHETPPDTYENVVKENITVQTPQSTIAELERAIDVARTPPNGPVRIGIPKNFLPMDVSLAEPGRDGPTSGGGVPAETISAGASLLADAKAPIVIAGGGVRASGASDELRSLAERLEAPVVTTYKGKGVFPDDHELSAGTLCGGSGTAIKTCLAEADAALGVGTDFDAVTTKGWSIDVPDDLVHVTLEATDVGTGYEPTVSIVADAGRTLSALEDELAGREIANRDGGERARRTRNAIADRLSELAAVDEPPVTSVSALEALREAIPRDSVVAVDAGGFRLWALVAFEAYAPRDYVNPGSWATMGTGVPSAIGAAVANPDQDIVAITGDGGLMMCVHELHTIADEGLDVTVVVLDNDDYAIISEEAERSYRMDAGEYGWSETPIDFQSVAGGMGLETRRAETPAEIAETVGDAIGTAGPVLVEIPTDPYEPQSGVWMNES
ncbi:thiamine pyrophosphate-binding protein [Natronobacterium gregoryi]|uniref:Thiamine pyrophosphate domain-containing TPP-binding protein n=2 Tax=Natronobacterium gregoryi TaxID=44930 RepID=L0AFD6_NATGS|nr:thiamine pyrophosphate-binding protein [Natronobacterium gregoryi]AFZ72134.1 thiamine pyrophosphate-dependent enzyme, possible carboligase or decarboxylase [Natronobacterium gregoryi SP2]ELY62836.1 thiamine pyrophosphate domain-containing TPP-binding protein [Natronobacterium gregoryi SP2]PLK19292.1 thiamine pyrophosphate-binding protein [Natronobacterium gregoryi SP2]SFJ54733.1 acetolactate synthase-1/2/3 large subunit [Natronobacterium gregoryi]